MGKNDEIYNAKIEQVDTPPIGGLCSGNDLNIWFPHAEKTGNKAKFVENYRKALEDTKTAKQICSECSIQITCLSYALYHESYGIWGGLTERERQTMRRKQGIKMIPREPVSVIVPGMNLR
ncbi:MAG: WhiB family transcriptional regulator [Bacteroidota bacterium]